MASIGLVESYETRLGFHRFACDFAKWAERSHEEPEDPDSPVPYYLYCRSIELVLKAYLLSQGVSKPVIASARLGHSLTKLFSSALDLGLEGLVVVGPKWKTELALADERYSSKDFEYFTVRFHFDERPGLDSLRAISAALRAAIKKPCLDAASGPPSPEVAAKNAEFERKRRRKKSVA